jgi:putative ABC transport system permease protein
VRRSPVRWTAIVGAFRLARRNVARQRARSAMALAAIALGVAAIIVAGGFIHDVYIQFAESIIHSQYGHVQVHRRGYALHGTQRPMDYLIERPAEMTARIARLTQGDIVLSRLRFVGLANAGGSDVPIVGEGVDPALENRLGTFVQLVAGRSLTNADRYALQVGDGVAKALRVAPGQQVTLGIVTPEGALNSLEFVVVGVFRTYSKDFDQRAVRLPLATAQELFATRGANEIVAVLGTTAATDATAAKLRAALPTAEYEVRTWRELADFYGKTVQLFDRQFGFMQTVLFLLIVLSVSNTINAAAFERLPEFGTMLALGDSPGDVRRLILLECAILGVVGSIIGIVVGTIVALALSAVGIPMPPPPNTDLGYTAQIRIVPQVLLGAFAVGTVSAIVAGVVPSWKISAMQPVDALRRAV